MGVNNMKILIAEDERDIALVYRVALKDRNHHLTLTAKHFQSSQKSDGSNMFTRILVGIITF